MKVISCFMCLLLLIVFNYSLSKAEYDKEKLVFSMTGVHTLYNVFKILSGTECDKYISVDYDNNDTLSDAEKYFDAIDYSHVLDNFNGDNFQNTIKGFEEKLLTSISTKKKKGFSIDEICTDFILKFEYSYSTALNNWNNDKKLYGFQEKISNETAFRDDTETVYNKEIIISSMIDLYFGYMFQELWSETECGKFVKINPDSFDIFLDAENYLTGDDYDQLLDIIASGNVQLKLKLKKQDFYDLVERKKNLGQHLDILCPELTGQLETIFTDALEKWDKDKKRYGKH